METMYKYVPNYCKAPSPHSSTFIIISLVLTGLFIFLYTAPQPLLGLGDFFSFLILYTVGRIPWSGISPLQGLCLHKKTTHTRNKRTQYRHRCREWGSDPRSQLSSERRQFMP
jgi:hypothetical protein